MSIQVPEVVSINDIVLAFAHRNITEYYAYIQLLQDSKKSSHKKVEVNK
jgi:hypothetical protein